MEETVDELKRKVADLEERVGELSRDDAYGVWTRMAFLQFCKVMPRGKRALMFLDFDGIHGLNGKIGYCEVDRRIKATFKTSSRASDIVARWYSGDEIVILFDADAAFAQKKVDELAERANMNGLSFTYEIGEWEAGRADVVDVANRLASKNAAKRKAIPR